MTKTPQIAARAAFHAAHAAYYTTRAALNAVYAKGAA